MIVACVFITLVILSCSVASVWGGATERWGAAIIASGTLGTWLCDHRSPFHWHGVEGALLAVDCPMLVAFAVMAALSSRFWPLWATAFQLLTVLSQAGPVFSRYGDALAFAIAEQLWGWVILLLITASSFSRYRNLRRWPASGRRVKRRLPSGKHAESVRR